MNNLMQRFFLLLFVLVVPAVSFAQFDVSRHDPLSSPGASALAAIVPERSNIAAGRNYLGLDLGLTYNWYAGASNFLFGMRQNTYDQFGNPVTINSYAKFDDLGSGLGFVLGIKGGFPLSNSIDLEGKFRYLTNYTSATSNHTIPVDINGSTMYEPVTSNYNLLLSNLDFDILAHVGLSDSWYAAGGIGFSTLLANRLFVHQVKNGGDPWSYYDMSGIVPTETGLTEITVDNVTKQNYFASSRAGVLLGAGSVWPLGSGSTLLDAELLVSIPLTEWLQDSGKAEANSWAPLTGQTVGFPKLWYASLTVGLRFPFGGEGEPLASTSSTSSQAEFGVPHGIGADGKVALTGRVTDAKTGQPIDANMTVVDLTNNEVVATDHTDQNGHYNVRVKAPGKYSVTADADGYLFGTSYFEVDAQGRILGNRPDIKLSPATGRTRLLVFFDFNSSDLKSESYPELNRAVKLLQAVPTMQVEIAGYTDNVGTEDYNDQLSARRANAVRDYLIKNGINRNRVKAKGYGEAAPIADNSTDDGRAENRRVEFVVLSK